MPTRWQRGWWCRCWEPARWPSPGGQWTDSVQPNSSWCRRIWDWPASRHSSLRCCWHADTRRPSCRGRMLRRRTECAGARHGRCRDGAVAQDARPPAGTDRRSGRRRCCPRTRCRSIGPAGHPDTGSVQLSCPGRDCCRNCAWNRRRAAQRTADFRSRLR